MSHANLPPAERDVIACLHRLREATARDLREAMAGYRPMKHESVLTLLKRLRAKKLVRREKGASGKAFVYRAVRRPQVTFRGILRQLLERTFHNDSVALVTSLFETRTPTGDEVERLQQLLDDLRKRRGPP